jgi:putative endonuclease
LLGFIRGRKRLLSDQKLLGKWGEKRCEKFLRNKGLKTLTRNYSCKTGEIDLIMVDGDGTIVFVEVKTRAEGQLAPPESSVTLDKQRKAVRTARFFLAVHNIEDRPLRFDVVGITLGSEGPPKIEHFENAFVP